MATTRPRRIWPVVLLVVGVGATAWWTLPADTATAASQPRVVAQEGRDEGQFLYRRDCAVCHGDDGRGNFRGPSLEGDGTASVDFYLRTGRMPITSPTRGLFRPTRPDYTDEQIEALVDYLRPVVEGGPDIPATDPTRGDVARGGAMYRAHCAGCHGTAGVGGALVLEDGSTPAVSGIAPRITAEAILVGPGTMPVMHPAPLDDEALDDVVAYVEHVLDDPPDPGGWHLWHLGPVPEGAVSWILGLGGLLLVARWIGSTVREQRGPEDHGEVTG